MSILDVARAAHPAVLTPARRRAIARHLELASITAAGLSRSGPLVAAQRTAQGVIATTADPDPGQRDAIAVALATFQLLLEHTEVACRQRCGQSVDEARGRMHPRADRHHARQMRRDRPWDGVIGRRR